MKLEDHKKPIICSPVGDDVMDVVDKWQLYEVSLNFKGVTILLLASREWHGYHT